MSFATDANHRATILREGNPIGGYLAVGSGSGWKRLMPSNNNAQLVDGNDWQLNIGTIRSDILDVTGWNLVILNPGYFQSFVITEEDSGVVTLDVPIQYTKALGGLGGIQYLMFPSLIVPLGISYKDNAASPGTLTIGVAKETAYTPSTPKTFAMLDEGELLIMHTMQIQNIFFQATQGHISWGEHYRA